jgi:cyclophilin family peptidyl-prolyl cis-trans isomerase/HEAT repeat protein
MRLRIFLPLLLLMLTTLACNFSGKETLAEIQSLEYLRKIDRHKFIGWLNSSDKEIRKQAVESLGRIQDTSTISWLINRLSDRDDSVREAAAFALGQFFLPAAEGPLFNALQGEKSVPVKSTMIEALGKAGTERSFTVLQHFLQDKNPDYQRAAAIACGILAYRGYQPYPILADLSRLLQSGIDPNIRWRCAYALYRTGSPTELKSLLNSLSDPDPLTRYFSLRAQSVIMDYLKTSLPSKYNGNATIRETIRLAKSTQYLDRLAVMLQDSTWYVRLASLQLLETLLPAGLFGKIKICLEDPNPHVRTTAMQTIAAFGTKTAANLLEKIITGGDDWGERGFALYQLSRFRSPTALRYVKDQMKNTPWPEDYYLLRTLDKIDTVKSTLLLSKMSDTENMAELSLILESLVKRKGISMQLMLEKLKLYDPAITTIIAEKLALIKDPAVVPVLLDSYHHFQPPQEIEPMIAIVAALDSIGSPDCVSFLEDILNSPVPPLRETAVRAVEKLTGRKVSIPETPDYSALKSDFPRVDFNGHPVVTIFTSRGNFEIMLFPDKAPITVANFLDLVKKDFYNNIYFHRVVPGFVIQAGDPRGDGWGGPGYSVPCEYNDLFYDRGVMGMAHAGKDTGGSQFFITHTPQPHLNGRHTAFGKVISGWDVVDQIRVYDQILHIEISEYL